MQTAQAEFDYRLSTRPLSTGPFESTYRRYILRYKPQPTPDGRFFAYVIILRSLKRLHTESAVMPDMASFENQIDAAFAGLEAGKRWVDHHCP